MPANAVRRDEIVAYVSNGLLDDVLQIVNTTTGDVVQRYRPLTMTSFPAPAAGTYRIEIIRNETVSASIEFVIIAPPTMELVSTSNYIEGYPLTVNLNGPIDPDDRVRMDVLGQADICPPCSDPAINKAASPIVLFENTPKAGIYQVRLLRRGRTIALRTFETLPFRLPARAITNP